MNHVVVLNRLLAILLVCDPAGDQLSKYNQFRGPRGRVIRGVDAGKGPGRGGEARERRRTGARRRRCSCGFLAVLEKEVLVICLCRSCLFFFVADPGTVW